MDVAEFKRLPILGILRDLETDSVEPLVESIVSSGLKTIEITMNTKDAPAIIRRIVKTAGSRLTVGAGTVLTKDDLTEALKSGATFIVLPTLVKEVVGYCVKRNIPVFPGALTPQEIYNAHLSGATMVKVFPSKFFGPEYLKEIKGPFRDIDLLACGGVNPSNIKSFFAAGASACAFGASIFKKEYLTGRKFREIENLIRELITGFTG